MKNEDYQGLTTNESIRGQLCFGINPSSLFIWPVLPPKALRFRNNQTNPKLLELLEAEHLCNSH